MRAMILIITHGNGCRDALGDKRCAVSRGLVGKSVGKILGRLECSIYESRKARLNGGWCSDMHVLPDK
jgi:hypothetical protein